MEAQLGDAGRVGSRADAGAAAAPRADAEPRTVLHLDIDAFFASVEQLRYPPLRGKPVIVGNGVIASCSYEARRYGCYAGQPLSEARRACPGVVILDGSEAVYAAFARKTFDLCAGVSPVLETFLDDAILDLTGSETLYGDFETHAARLKERIRAEVGLPVTVGIGPNRMLAKIAAKSVKPDGLRRIRTADIETVLPGLPVDRLPGVGRAVHRELAKLNVHTIGDLRAFPADLLQRMFGLPGRALHDRARGRDTRVVEAREIPKSISRETAFHEPVTDPREMEGMLYYLLERAARHGRELGLAARTVRVWIDYLDSGRAAAQIAGDPSDQDAVLFERAKRILRRLLTRREAVRRIGVSLSRFSAGVAGQSELFENGADAGRERLTHSLDRVRARFGHASVVAGPSVRFLGKLRQDRNGFILRTPSLTK